MDYYSDSDSEGYFPYGLEDEDDSDYTSLNVGADFMPHPRRHREWETMGRLIGNHKHLTQLIFCDIYTVPREFFEAAMRGVAQNRSLEELVIVWCNGVWGSICQILEPLLLENKNLSKFVISLCDNLGVNEIHPLSLTLGRCTCSSLTELDFSQNQMSDDVAEELVASLSGLPKLAKLNMRNNYIGTRSCAALSTLLRNHPTLIEVKLGSNRIDDEGVEALVDGLSENNVLTELCLSDVRQANGGRNTITVQGWKTFAYLLCNDSNVKATYYDSNHTLCNITDPDSIRDSYFNQYDEDGFQHPIPAELRALLKMNNDEDKKVVARQKVIRQHHVMGDDSIDSFADPDTELKLLPYILVWIGKSSLSDSFQFVRNTPTLCE